MKLGFLSCGVALLAAGAAFGRPEHKQTLKHYYGDALPQRLFACATCHVVPQGMDEKALAEQDPQHNVFGTRLRELGEQREAAGQAFDLVTRLKLVAEEDADGDGVANELEIIGGRAPGDASDMPVRDELPAVVAARERFLQQYRWEPFSPVARPAVPAVGKTAWVRNPIDAFVAAEHEARGLLPRPEAPPHVLLRRVYLDLIGLPPTRDELHTFLADDSADAYERVVDRLLADSRYGERWGRHWMDVWRYSDWAGWGKQIRDSQPHIWRWRDWIVESLNRDLPYDQMIVEMLAADELRPLDRDALRATGFLVRNFKLLSREQWMQDTVDHTALAFLGLTMKCARCHDHMYDPITQREYYQMRAIFEPHHVRLDRVPGELDTAVDGLARVFDSDPKAATYFYIRGDERTPDKDQAMSPGVPAALGGAFSVEEFELPQEAHSPEKAAFVVEMLLAADERAVAEARAKLAAAEKKVAELTQSLANAEGQTAAGLDAARAELVKSQQQLSLAQLDVPLAITRQASLSATIHVERLEDAGAKESDSAAWRKAATDATNAQREAAVLEGRRAELVAEQMLSTAEAAKAAAEKQAAEKPEDAKLKQAVEKTTSDLAAAGKKLGESRQQLAKAEEAAKAEPSVAYTPRAIKTYPATSTGRRLAFASWIAHRDNPLTARVAVNHIWLRHFGQALVESVFDFGRNGRRPTHPPLVDWLAAELMEPSVETSRPTSSPWSMKHLHKLIVTSATYRMQSTPDEKNLAADPDNHWLWRMPSRRLEGEVVRDSVLYVAGQLDPAQGGPELDHALGLTSRRRSLYFRHAAEKQMTLLKLFDAPAVTECYQRKESIVPQQALALANSSLVLEQSRRLARRAEWHDSPNRDFIAAAFETILSRPATTEEIAACEEFLSNQAELLSANASRMTQSTADVADVSKPAADITLRARENLVHVLLNHHEFVTVR